MRIFIFFLLLTVSLEAASPRQMRALYNSLNQKSVTEHLAFYELYPETTEGKNSLQYAWSLLSGRNNTQIQSLNTLPSLSTIRAIISLINKQSNEESPTLDTQELNAINRLANHLPNRLLKGHSAKTEEEVLALDPKEIDLARALFLTEVESEKLQNYEAMIDLMALQILVHVPMNAAPKEKIRAINRFIFEEMGFRFPPHSLYAKDIDVYTFLPAVLDSRRGVCLGVSTLYICLAQRLDLPLEMITPPGHIYVRYRDGDTIINIETTARGIHVDNEQYLGVETRSLEQRTIKEVIGMAHYNRAAGHWKHKQYEQVLASYEKALPYMPDDMLLHELMGYTHLVLGNITEGNQLLEKVRNHLPDYAIKKNSVAEDYLTNRADIECIKTIMMDVDETRESIFQKKETLEGILEKHPKFRAGVFSLAATWLQLHREGEALKVLERYHEIEPNDPTVEYYLAMLYLNRYKPTKAWKHLENAEALTQERDHNPKALKQLRKQLNLLGA